MECIRNYRNKIPNLSSFLHLVIAIIVEVVVVVFHVKRFLIGYYCCEF